jgi:tight adherence protein C
MLVGIPFLCVFTLIAILYLLGNKKGYKKEIDNIDKTQYPLKDFIAVGLYIVDTIGISKFKKVNSDTFSKMLSLYGIESNDNFRIYEANKCLYMLCGWASVYLLMLANGEFSLPMTLLGPLAMVGVFFLIDSTLNNDFEKRSLKIKYEFPEFLSKLTLLINAGLTVEGALDRIVTGNKNETPLYYEMKKTLLAIKGQKGVDEALKDLSRRTKVKEITKFASIIMQSMMRGSADIVGMLNQLSFECWESRKNMAKQKGEEASTKLLFPMMLMLAAVFLLVMTPAMLQISNF